MKGNHLVEESKVFWDGRGRKGGRVLSSIMKTTLIAEV